MKALVQEMQTSLGSHTEVESLMITLVTQLESVTDKKKYGYLPKAVKKTVDEIVNLMEQLPIIDECYQTWWELQCQIENFYSERERRRPPLSEQKEFRSIKNAVIQKAENICMGKVTFEDEEMEEPTESSGLPYDCWGLWMVTQDDTAPMADRDETATQLIATAESGNPDAQYLAGRLYREGPVLIPDSVEAGYWLDQSARQGVAATQYALGQLYLTFVIIFSLNSGVFISVAQVGAPLHTGVSVTSTSLLEAPAALFLRALSVRGLPPIFQPLMLYSPTVLVYSPAWSIISLLYWAGA